MSANSTAGRMNEQSRLLCDARRRRACSLPGLLSLGVLLGLLLLSSACTATTVLQAGFNSDTVNSPPSPNQTVGTVSVSPGTVVVAAPTPTLPSNKWVRLTKTDKFGNLSSIRGNFSGPNGLGNYTLEASLFIPSKMGDVPTGAVSLEFDSLNLGPNPLGFMHIDFMPEGDVRIDDDEKQRFGHYPRDQPFAVTVNLVITDAKATAHIQLFGTGTSGSFDATVNPDFLRIAHNFGAVTFFMGTPWQGAFFVDDIIVTRKG